MNANKDGVAKQESNPPKQDTELMKKVRKYQRERSNHDKENEIRKERGMPRREK